MEKILVIGASGFIGRQIAISLLGSGYSARCLSRDPERVQDLKSAGCEIIQGDVSQLASVNRAVDGVSAVFVAIHTLSPQPGGGAKQRFMEVELKGLENIVSACRQNAVRRLIYVTSLGVAADAPSEWLRERWKAEQYLLASGLDVTCIRPGMIVGRGGRGFEMLAGQARKSLAIGLAGSKHGMRTIWLDDLVYYIVGVLKEPRSYGQSYDVGNDEVLTNSQIIDANADILNHRRPIKLAIPRAILSLIAPIAERAGKLPRGSLKGFLDSLDGDGSGHPLPIREILPRPLLTFRQAAERTLEQPASRGWPRSLTHNAHPDSG